ncbi:hypothetical protein Q8A67_015490 [Cirrhinus molitorella]|uniref:Secreted protein n=1 Tax=Cirrhinus molitorella TaxID=172907 RepID=A0AA88PHV0_9TELE|nr:hypothetical protein Q8A67_015490 [Cirrhinus molitorella]
MLWPMIGLAFTCMPSTYLPCFLRCSVLLVAPLWRNQTMPQMIQLLLTADTIEEGPPLASEGGSSNSALAVGGSNQLSNAFNCNKAASNDFMAEKWHRRSLEDVCGEEHRSRS